MGKPSKPQNRKPSEREMICRLQCIRMDRSTPTNISAELLKALANACYEDPDFE